ncbi:MAG: bifunctional (p)ppGpp synthetase/guanosine-3',5'-bis(diphosphate) 3'-pyrophosphohydrolase [Lachnospiraceae bacterium]|nr:bifunctional (p)ppGpp synthetase/guanosine-3',5'-bis(diphosphate) 3'-pyrophosphohydrolase [Lachnospiraceae bacterium]
MSTDTEDQKKENTIVIDNGRIEDIEEFRAPEALYADLLKRLEAYGRPVDTTLIEKAYKTASAFHRGQERKSGEPYLIHPLCVAIILADLEMDEETIAAGILHDVVEDTVMTIDELTVEFGREVAFLVDGVTKLSKIQYSTDKLDLQAENLRKMFLAMAHDMRVIMIKLSDRLHNMRTLSYHSREKQIEIARETLDIYAPIAQRLGISKIKVELEDLCLKYLEPEDYKNLSEMINSRKYEREQVVQSIVDEVSRHMKEAGISAKIDGRAKHFFSIYKKMKNQNKTLDQIYDLFAVRIIVASVKDCYAALGVIHEMYKPIPGRFKDYIAVPKANMYQSLHTTLAGANGVPFEIQIRTFEMHRTAEYGIAAHWKYKEASNGHKVGNEEEEKLNWLQQILDWQQELPDNREYMKLLKSDLDLFSDSVYCFTPAGDVKNLPAGSTPVDFAYSIHSAVGNRMIGARVNGKLVTINYTIKNGDVIEIITSQSSRGPSRDWLSIVKSPQARSKIQQFFKGEDKAENIEHGKELFAAYCKARNINPQELTEPAFVELLLKKYRFRDWDNVMAAVGHGALKEGQVVNRLLEYKTDYDRLHISDEDIYNELAEKQAKSAHSGKKHPASGDRGITINGIDGVSVRFPKCCSPLPGDDIIGYVTRGRGVTVHRRDCVNISTIPEDEKDRLVEASWQDTDISTGERAYTAEVTVYATTRPGLLADISKCISDSGMEIRSLNTRTSRHGTVTMNLNFDVKGRAEANIMIGKLKNIDNVLDVKRNTGKSAL